MENYGLMSKSVGTKSSNINDSLSVVKNISFDGVWSGDAYNSLSSALEQTLTRADNVKSDLEKFSSILTELERYKALKERIDKLTEEINSISIPSDPKAAAAAESRKNFLIAQRDKLIEEKNQLRQKIESELASFESIESQVSVINFNVEDHKEYLDYLEELYKQFGGQMTSEEFLAYLNMLGIGNLLPKNNSDIAHRGSHPGGIYENSLEAFIAAGESGFWGCETDVRFDENGNLVCSHNAVKDGENPVSFEEYLDICKKYGMTAIIDLKYANGLTRNPDTELSPAIIKIIEEKGMLDSCVLQTNHFNDIPYIRSQSDDVRIWLLGHNNVTDENIKLALENNVECINFNNSEYNVSRIKKVTEAGLDACVWNVQSETTKQQCLNAGATYVMSDNVLGITPYKEGETDFNAVKGNYVNTQTNSTYNIEGIKELLKTTSSTSSSSSSTYKYNGPILCANPDDPTISGRLDYVRSDGVTVQESWCDINLENTKELSDFFKFDGEKVVEGTKIKDMKYWVRDDGVQMIGDYVAVATDVIPRKTYGIDDNMGGWNGKTYNYGDVVETTLGKGIVMGVCTYAVDYREQHGDMYTNLEIYTLWNTPGISNKVWSDDYVPPNYAHDPLLINK